MVFLFYERGGQSRRGECLLQGDQAGRWQRENLSEGCLIPQPAQQTDQKGGIKDVRGVLGPRETE